MSRVQKAVYLKEQGSDVPILSFRISMTDHVAHDLFDLDR